MVTCHTVPVSSICPQSNFTNFLHKANRKNCVSDLGLKYIRWVLAYAGAEYEDVRFEREQWAEEKPSELVTNPNF